jgi:hypothetical protein
MTEAEWQQCPHTQFMLGGIYRGRISDRKLRLFACACIRRVLHLPTVQTVYAESLRGVETAEKYADGQATAEELAAAANPFVLMSLAAVCSEDANYAANMSAAHAENIFAANSSGPNRTLAERARQTLLLRDIAGSPFRQVVRCGDAAVIRDERNMIHIEDEWLRLPRWLAWNGGVVRELARSAYDDRRFEELGILADALEEAGCTDTQILDHLRSNGPHVRGCWAVDLLLGRE